MVVTNIYAAGEESTLEAARDFMAVEQADNGVTALGKGRGDVLEEIRVLSGLCNAAEFDAATLHLPISERKINGDATDQAVLRMSESLGSVAKLRDDWKKVFEIAFNSKNKFMVRIISPVSRVSSGNETYVLLYPLLRSVLTVSGHL
jgi:sodium/potassium-transporting ATPase subunit alpha